MNVQHAICCAVLAAAGWLAVLPGPAFAQSWPARTVTIVVPFTPGVTVDISARVVGEQLAKQIGQPVVIENRGGAGGTIGAGMVAKSAPDGHTLLVSGSLGSANAMFANLPYDTLRDFVGVHSLGLQPLVLVSAPDKPFKTLRELIAAAKAKPGALNYASGGMGSATHLAGERIRISAGIDVQHVPFKGAGEALREVMAGRVDFYATPVPSALALIQSGKVVALAVSAQKRSAVLPDVPTTAELGLANSAYLLYAGLFAPAKTPPADLLKIHQEVDKALQAPAVKERLAKLGAEPMPMSQPEFDRYFRADVESNVKLVKDAKIEMLK
jgi:tripartite-type tricarboxylate transporter receptor subunit TctC